MRGERAVDLGADREHRIECAHRLLENHADPIAAEPAVLILR